MTSPELETALTHLRQLGDRIMSALNDLGQIRALIDEYADVHPSTGVLKSLNVVNSQHRQQFQICRPLFQVHT